MNFDNNFSKFKIYKLQKTYKKITDLIYKFEIHINELEKNLLLESNKNFLINEIFEINKTLNTKYNNYISELSNNVDVPDFFEILSSNYSDEINMMESINKLDSKMELIYKSLISNPPLKYSYEKIKQLINNNGLDSFNSILELNFGNNYNNYLESDLKDLLNEINSISFIKSFSTSQKEIKENYLWEIPKEYDDFDKLEKKRILYLKIQKNVYKIELYFKIDYLSIYIKTCQINYPNLYFKKNQSINFIENEYPELDFKFLKTFIRHDYLGNLYCMDHKEYANYFKLTYYKYLEYVNTSFINIMKDFISQETSIKYIYNLIYLHLIGDDESNDVAAALIGLIKEKKQFEGNIYNFIINNLTYYLQMKIQKSESSLDNEIEKLKEFNIDSIDYKKQLSLNKNIPDNVKSLTIEKIEELKSMNNDYFKQLTYVKNIINFPWSNNNESKFFETLQKDPKKSKSYIKNIEDKLENLSYGHKEAKKLLLQIIGKWISNPSSQGTVFSLVGPPGVGKTLLAKSISSALDIPFAQITLGGQNDGEILHGHGYTYSGSQPGLIVKKMVEMGKSRCILYFDELDKACSKHGHVNEISSILIHLTDPNMNKSFQDRFFQGIDFPLDKVIMIFSYNDSSLVDPILLDRLKEIKINPYTNSDKLKICDNFIIPELEKNIGFASNTLLWNEKIIDFIIDNYTNEAGVRGIKRLIEKIYMKLNIDKILKEGVFKSKKKKINVSKKLIIDILSEPNASDTVIHKKPHVGIINGMYATTNGDGGIIPIQIYKNYSGSSDSYDIKLTGSQGDVMKESVQCSLTTALQYLEKNKKKYKIKNINEYLISNFKNGFHVHTPSTSTPKDGPSAGCAFTSAFISLILNKPIINTISMTGEIELTGRVTKIGGLNFKLIGAKKAGVKTVYICKENEKDLIKIKKDYPKLINKNFQVKIVEYIEDFIDEILK